MNLSNRLYLLALFLGMAGAFEIHSQAPATESPPDAQGRTLKYFPPTLIPIDYDLAGTWRLESLFGTLQTVWPFSKYAAVNYSMYGRDYFQLVRTKAEVQTYPSPETTVLRIHYSGFYHHIHSTGKVAPLSVSELGSWIGAVVNYDCFQEEHVFPIAGYLSIYQRAGVIVDFGLNLQASDGKAFPRARHPSVYDQGTDYGIPGYTLFQNQIGSLLAANFSISHPTPEPKPSDNCNLVLRDPPTLEQVIYGEDSIGRPSNRVFYAYFRRESSPIPENARGVIRGVVQDGLNNITITNAIVRLCRQDKYIRPRAQNEASQDYSRYVESRVVRLDEVRTDSQGNFEFKDVALVHRRFEDSSAGEPAIANYTLQVVHAEADGSFLSNPNISVIHYEPRFVPNVQPKEPDSERMIIRLVAETVFAAKSELVVALTNASPNNYSKIDAPVLNYLTQLQSGAVSFTAEREEGLKRAIWAERAVREGVSRADQFIGVALEGLGTLLGDVYGALFEYASKDTREGAEFLSKVKAGETGPIHTSFKLPSGPNWMEGMDKLFQAGKKFELYDGAEKMLKTISAGFQSSLIVAGLDTPQAIYIGDTIHLVLKTLVAAIKSNHAAGSTLEFQKVVIQEMTKQLAPVLLDNSLEINLHLPWKQTWETDQDLHQVIGKLPAFPSYCKLTAPSLALSVEKMQSWSSRDREKYLADITKTSALIEALNQTATSLAIAMEYSKATAKSADAIGDFAGVVSQVSGENPYAKALEITASITKWLANVATTVAPMTFVYVQAPAKVEEAVQQAYGIKPAQSPLEESQKVRSLAFRSALVTALPPTLPVTLSSARSQLNTASRRLTLAIKTNDLGLALSIASEGTNGYLAALSTFQRTLRQATAQAAGLQPTNEATGKTASDLVLQEIAFGLQSHGFSRQLASFFASVLTGEFANTDDAAYLQRRNELLMSQQSLALDVDNAVSYVSTWQSDNRLKPHVPSVMVELDPPVSEKTGGTSVTASPEVFVIRGHFSNLSSLPLSNLTARLQILSQPGLIQLLSPTNQPVGNGILQALDSKPLSGPDEAEIQWRFSCQPQLASKVIHLTVDLLESGASPVSFIHSAASRMLQASPTLSDRDQDGLPDDYEVAHGLNPNKPDGLEDPDGDGLNNLAEFARHTDPKLADTDGDGLSDGREVLISKTDPLDPDSDGDGTPDGADLQPTNPSSQSPAEKTAEPAVGIELTSARLNATNRTLNLVITNRGSGTLFWTAKAENPAVLEVYPAFPATSFSGDSLTISLPLNNTATNHGNVLTRVRVMDMGGSDRDFVDIMVVSEGALDGPKQKASFSRIQRLEDGTVLLTLVGEPGEKQLLETSTRLDTWTPLVVLTNRTGSVDHLDKPPLNIGSRFYRSTRQP